MYLYTRHRRSLIPPFTSYDIGLQSQTCLTGVIFVALSSINPSNLGPKNADQTPYQYCPPTPECKITHLETLWNTCQQIQDPYVPMTCKLGYYCLAGDREQIVCPRVNTALLDLSTPFNAMCYFHVIKAVHNNFHCLEFLVVIIDISLALLFG
ncbi:uncharacterized protein EAE97_002434 [Botrytis byssoidea]|uniref:Uncharacterized protein n=1 Tax=Botrytis byssoidea TaxID=139641 RepID=A0A9P5LXP6_9HELO|nr:uncharacterized protein EAE97_002434 [Botrytis byssoidea]KAF7950882.1 hypothetical protein EAE97_002434 [Botrytis byssoidea]